MRSDWNDEPKVQELMEPLSRFTVPEPDEAGKRQLIARMKMELSMGHPARNASVRSMSDGRNDWKSMFRSQARLFPARYWASLIVLYAVVVAVLVAWPQLIMDDKFALQRYDLAGGVHPFILIMPLISAAGVIYSLRAVGTPMFELELSLPSSFAHIVFIRLIIVTASNIVVGLAVSYPLAVVFGISVIPFVVSWLAPLLLYSAVSLLALIRFGVWSGSLWTLLCWIIPYAFRSKLGVLNVFSQPWEANWAISKMLTTLITIPLILLITLTIKKQRIHARPGGGFQ